MSLLAVTYEEHLLSWFEIELLKSIKPISFLGLHIGLVWKIVEINHDHGYKKEKLGLKNLNIAFSMNLTPVLSYETPLGRHTSSQFLKAQNFWYTLMNSLA